MNPRDIGREVWCEGEGDRLEVERKGFRLHVIRAQRITVKVTRAEVDGRKQASVHHDVTINVAHAQSLHPLQQL